MLVLGIISYHGQY